MSAENITKGKIALKEWAVAVKALTEGKQIMILRKGGIAEETRDFQLQSPRFFLLPAFEHQRLELLKEDYRGDLREIMETWKPESAVVEIGAFAEAVEDIEIHDQQTVDLLAEHHIWTDSFTEERLRWKRSKPLHLLLLRVSKLAEPVQLPMRDAYTGCKSWVNLEEFPSDISVEPVLSDEEFTRRAEAIRRAIGK
ncbi:DUF1802 family protein [Paenibacillus sp. R14(2021)]|uniref:DUF1802 family protein n=1 Tax=Paenibacillus sp. R14(2021) TaxID=2859228 RepID=UPI001C6148AF|nr:DUF1802 family protein [Paenibacillus sp. R14(2021)]